MILTCKNDDCQEKGYWTTHGFCPKCGNKLENANGEEKKQVGIIFNNWKKRKFKRAMESAGFEFKIKPYTANTSAMFIHTEEENFEKIRKVCVKCQIDLKLSN